MSNAADPIVWLKDLLKRRIETLERKYNEQVERNSSYLAGDIIDPYSVMQTGAALLGGLRELYEINLVLFETMLVT